MMCISFVIFFFLLSVCFFLGWVFVGLGRVVARWAGCRWYGSGCGSQSGDLAPDGESAGHFGALGVSGEPMAAGPEVR